MKIILLGLGVQSTCLYLKSSLGQFPRADYAIFSDVGGEAEPTYRYLEFLLQWQKKHKGIPIHVLKVKNLYKDLLSLKQEQRFTTIPAFTKNADGSIGMLKRQCTAEYKIVPVDNFIRDSIYLLPKRARRPQTDLWYGISTDEIERAAIPQARWKLNIYPFLCMQVDSYGNSTGLPWGQKIDRQGIIQWYKTNGFPVPPKSSCIFCPYQSDEAWEDKKNNNPEDFNAAIKIDEAIRNMTSRGIKSPVYLHRSCRPLKEIVFDNKSFKDLGNCSTSCHL